VVLLDQRGAGKSTPHAELRENTTQHLVSDIEALRTKLKIQKWHLVFGGSWGSTLALVYAQAYPDVVGSLILRGIFTVRQSELQFSRGPIGAANIFPEEYERFVNWLPEEDRDHPNEAYYRLLTSDDHATRVAAAREWNRWDLSTGTLLPDLEAFAALDDEKYIICHARLEAHYFVNRGFMEEGQILKDENLAKIRHIPTTIVQGRYDIVCAPQTA
jgi:proline iminopeptidase